MNDIEKAIREKKAEIKKANREMSELQDELKKKDEPRKVKVIDVRMDYDMNGTSNIRMFMSVISNKNISSDEVWRAIESLSDKPKEPKSYVDWNDPKLNGYNWVAFDDCLNNRMAAYISKPIIGTSNIYWCPSNKEQWLEYGHYIGKEIDWRDSLIHRPGVKE